MKKIIHEEDGQATVQGNMLNQPLNDELKTSYINYAMSVNHWKGSTRC